MLRAIKKYWLHVATVLLVLGSVRFVLIHLDDPFTWHHHLCFHQGLQGAANENYSHLGLAYGFGVGHYRKDDRCDRGYYINHPALSVVLSWVPTIVLGNEEWVIRGVQLVLYFFDLLLLYLIGARLLDERSALVMVVVYAYTPINRIHSILPAWHGTWFFTFALLLLYFITRHSETGRRRDAFMMFFLGLLCVLNEWTGAPYVFLITVYYFVARRPEVWKGLFWSLFVLNLGVFLNFLHISILRGRVSINEPIAKFLTRTGGVVDLPSQLQFLGFQFFMGFGMVAVFALGLGVYALLRSKNRVLHIAILGQLPICLFYLAFFRQAMVVHWYLWMVFSIPFTLLVGCIVHRFKGAWVPATICVVLFANSEWVFDRYESNRLNEGARPRPQLAAMVEPRQVYDVADAFLRSKLYDTETLVLVDDDRFYVNDYYLGKAGYCSDVAPRNPDRYNGLKGFARTVFISLDANKRLKVREILRNTARAPAKRR